MEMPNSSQSQAVSPIDLGLADRLENDAQFRARYLRRFSSSEVAAELRAMRVRRQMRQVDLATEARTGQSAISRIEKQDYDGWSYQTLLAIALVLRARLRIRLEPIEDVIEEYRRSESDTHNTLDALSGIESVGSTSADTSLAEGDDTYALVEEADSTPQTGWLS